MWWQGHLSEAPTRQENCSSKTWFTDDDNNNNSSRVVVVVVVVAVNLILNKIKKR
jgi:hypothetical protein